MKRYRCNFTAFLYYSTTDTSHLPAKKKTEGKKEIIIHKHTQCILHHRGTHHNLIIQTCTWKYTVIFLQISIQICDSAWLEIQQISFISLYKIASRHTVFLSYQIRLCCVISNDHYVEFYCGVWQSKSTLSSSHSQRFDIIARLFRDVNTNPFSLQL